VVGIAGGVDAEQSIGALIAPEIVVDGTSGREHHPVQLGELPRLPAPAPRPEPKVVVDARARFSGESCRNCGGVRLRRSGSCLVCEDCGESGGCS